MEPQDGLRVRLPGQTFLPVPQFPVQGARHDGYFHHQRVMHHLQALGQGDQAVGQLGQKFLPGELFQQAQLLPAVSGLAGSVVIHVASLLGGPSAVAALAAFVGLWGVQGDSWILTAASRLASCRMALAARLRAPSPKAAPGSPGFSAA